MFDMINLKNSCKTKIPYLEKKILYKIIMK